MLSSHLYTPIYKSTNLHVNQLLVGGFNPLRKICWSNWIISNLGRGENKKCLKQPPTRLQLQLNCHLYFHLHLPPMKFPNDKKPGRLRCWSAATEVRSPMDLQCLPDGFLGRVSPEKKPRKKKENRLDFSKARESVSKRYIIPVDWSYCIFLCSW